MTGEQLRAARAMLSLKQAELAARAGVSEPTVKRLEAVDGPLSANTATVDKLVRALEAAGVEFIAPNGGGAGVRLRRRDALTG